MTEPAPANTVSHSDRVKVVADLFAVKPMVYWLDFGLSIILGWIAFVLAVQADTKTAVWVLSSLVSVFALYRAVLFTHELAHFKHDFMKEFRAVWNATCGFPLMVPSFLYHGVHNEHHFRDRYGTPGDGEYLTFGTPPRSKIFWYLISHFVLPPWLVVRFALLGPVSWLFPTLRHWVWQRVSSLSIDHTYHRQVPEVVPSSWITQETLCSIYVWCALVALYIGVLPLALIGQWYLVSVAILILNALRTLAAHRYRNSDGKMTFDAQLLDSVNIVSGFLTPLLAPVGLRYHATHHLFPTIPYHNLGKAHHQMNEQLPNDMVYQQTLSPSFWRTFSVLWRNSAASDKSRV